MYGGCPPNILIVTDPEFSPKQATLVIFSVDVIPFGSIMVKLNVEVQLFASVTSTE